MLTPGAQPGTKSSPPSPRFTCTLRSWPSSNSTSSPTMPRGTSHRSPRGRTASAWCPSTAGGADSCTMAAGRGITRPRCVRGRARAATRREREAGTPRTTSSTPSQTTRPASSPTHTSAPPSSPSLAPTLGLTPPPPFSWESFRFLVHFLGDIHQPLHLTSRERGGNGDPVLWEGRRTNLHSLWDGLLIARALREQSNYTAPLPRCAPSSPLSGCPALSYNPLTLRGCERPQQADRVGVDGADLRPVHPPPPLGGRPHLVASLPPHVVHLRPLVPLPCTPAVAPRAARPRLDDPRGGADRVPRHVGDRHARDDVRHGLPGGVRRAWGAAG